MEGSKETLAAETAPAGPAQGASWSFADAMARVLHEGWKVKRDAWGGCSAIYFQPAFTEDVPGTEIVEDDGSTTGPLQREVLPACVLLRTPDGPVEWVPEMDDMLATDWTIAE